MRTLLGRAVPAVHTPDDVTLARSVPAPELERSPFHLTTFARQSCGRDRGRPRTAHFGTRCRASLAKRFRLGRNSRSSPNSNASALGLELGQWSSDRGTELF